MSLVPILCLGAVHISKTVMLRRVWKLSYYFYVVHTLGCVKKNPLNGPHRAQTSTPHLIPVGFFFENSMRVPDGDDGLYLPLLEDVRAAAHKKLQFVFLVVFS